MIQRITFTRISVFDYFPKHCVKMLGDFSAKVERKYIFKPPFSNCGLRGINKDNGVRVVNFAI